MRRAAVALALLATGCGTQAPPDDGRTATPKQVTTAAVTLHAADGLSVYGTYYRAPRPRAMILLFHQAGSSSDEYRAIGPRLAAAGFSALAIDQRSGGTMFGINRTAGQLRRDPGYMPALKDMQAAVDWAEAQGLPIILWGSSYSAALVFLLADANAGRIKAVLAFSPAEYLPHKGAVARAAAKLSVPAFIATADSSEEAAAKPVLDALNHDRTDYLRADGIHGSSALIDARNPAGAERNWDPVMRFLRRIVG